MNEWSVTVAHDGVRKREENPWSGELQDRSSLPPGAGHHQALSPTSGALQVKILPFCHGSEGCCRVRCQPRASWERPAAWGTPRCRGDGRCNALRLALLPSLREQGHPRWLPSAYLRTALIPTESPQLPRGIWHPPGC